MPVIRETHEGVALFIPHLLEPAWALGADDQDLCTFFRKLIVVLAQLREMCPAVGSREAACKDQYHIPLVSVFG